MCALFYKILDKPKYTHYNARKPTPYAVFYDWIKAQNIWKKAMKRTSSSRCRADRKQPDDERRMRTLL